MAPCSPRWRWWSPPGCWARCRHRLSDHRGAPSVRPGGVALDGLDHARRRPDRAVDAADGDRLIRRPIVVEASRQSEQRRWALRLRVSVLLLLALAVIAERTGGSRLVAGFAAGIVLRRFREPHRLALQLSGLANGFFVPAFFVLLGATLNLRLLMAAPAAIGLALAMPIASLVVHLVGAAIAGRARRPASGLLASAQLGLPAAAASLGLAAHSLSPAVAAALVAGGCLTLIPASVGAALLVAPASRPEPPDRSQRFG